MVVHHDQLDATDRDILSGQRRDQPGSVAAVARTATTTLTLGRVRASLSVTSDHLPTRRGRSRPAHGPDLDHTSSPGVTPFTPAYDTRLWRVFLDM